MPAPSKSWVTVIDGQVDSDSPVDSVLMTGLRDDLVHLREWLGSSYTAQVNHTHNGVDSALVTSIANDAVTTAKIAAANVTLAKLKMTEGSYAYTGNGGTTIYTTISRYTHAWYASVTNADNSANTYQITGPYVDVTATGTREPALKIDLPASDGSGIAFTIYWPYHDN